MEDSVGVAKEKESLALLDAIELLFSINRVEGSWDSVFVTALVSFLESQTVSILS